MSYKYEKHMCNDSKNLPLRMLCVLAVLIVAIFPAYDSALANDAPMEARSIATGQSSSEDTIAPETFITVPIKDFAAGRTTVYRGYATDDGGSGISRVQIAIRDATTGQWFNFINKKIGPITDSSGKRVGITTASLTDSTATYTDWSISLTLPDGSYQFFALAIDNAENSQYTGKGVWPVNIPFLVN